MLTRSNFDDAYVRHNRRTLSQVLKKAVQQGRSE
jgi:hypothetical protein